MTTYAAAWRRYLAAPPGDRLLLAALAALLPAAAASIRLLGLRRVYSFLSRHPGNVGATLPGDLGRARALARLVDAAARRLPGRPACLTRSVTLWWLLRRRGIDSALRIGVRTGDGRLEAHAWVELGGEVVNDREDVGTRFRAFEGL